MAHVMRPHHGAPTKYLHLHAVSERASVLQSPKLAGAHPSERSCTLSCASTPSSPRSGEGHASSSPEASRLAATPFARGTLHLDGLSTEMGRALRFCNDLLCMDDGELVVMVVLAKRCIDTGLPLSPTNVHLFALSVALIACKIHCDEPHTVEQVAMGSGLAFGALQEAEWFVFGWLVDRCRLHVSASEHDACATVLFHARPPPPPAPAIVPAAPAAPTAPTAPTPPTPPIAHLSWLVGGVVVTTAMVASTCSSVVWARARSASAPSADRRW